MARVLVIEDEPPILDNIIEILLIGGHSAEGAPDGIAGVAKAHQMMPELILCDINMPQMDGFGVLMELRSDPRTSLIPFVFLTAYADKPFQRRGMNLGAADYLTKPFGTKELLAAVEAQLEKAAEQEAIRKAELQQLRNNIVMALPHELRTPLTGIVTCADMMLMDFDDDREPDLPRIEQLLRIVHRSGLRLQHMIENYLVYSQIELFTKDPDRRHNLTAGEGIMYPMEYAHTQVETVAASAERKDDITVGAEVHEMIRVSPTNWTKIIAELLDNALKFSEPGTPVTIDGNVEEGEFVLSISDKGRGMTPEQSASVGAYMQFERQVYEQQGIGLGLAVVKRLAQLHGGKMHINSEPEMGTTVRIYLPLMEMPAVEQG